MARVDVYGKQSCTQCVMLTRWLDSRNISFDYHDVGKYPEEIEKLRRETANTSLPQYCYEGEWHYGFDLAKLQRLFNRE